MPMTTSHAVDVRSTGKIPHLRALALISKDESASSSNLANEQDVREPVAYIADQILQPACSLAPA